MPAGGGTGRAAPTSGAALAFVALTLALVGQYVLRQGPPFPLRLLLGAVLAYGVAAVAFLWLASRGRMANQVAGASGDDAGGGLSVGALSRSVRRAPLSWALILTALVLSFEVGITLWTRGDLGETYWDVFGLWLLSIGLFLLPLARPWRLVSANRPPVGLRRFRQPLLDSAALFAIAILLRLPRLGDIPDVFGGDEGIVGEVSRTMASHAGNMFATMFAYGKLYYLLISRSVALFGSTAFAVRLPSALGGALAASVVYLAGREMFGRRVGLVAGLLLAVAHMHIHVSRTAHGQALDTLVAAGVLFALARGLKRGSLWWMGVAGVGLGLAQYIYVAARLIDIIAVIFFVVLAVTDHRLWRRSLAGFAAAFGAALVTAVPIIVWAVRRPGDYLARISSVGFAQTGGFGEGVEATGAPVWRVIADQVGTAILVPIALPARAFYDASIPMLDLAWAALFVLGLVLAIRRFRDWRYLLLLLFVFGGVVLLALSNLIELSAYRITVVMPAFALLAAVALVLLAEQGLSGLGLRPRVVALAIGVAVGVIGVRNVGYYFFDHVPNCRYMERDAATASVSMATRFISENAPDARIYALTEPEFSVGSFPNSHFYTGRMTRAIDDPDAPGPFDPDGNSFIHAVGPDYPLLEHLESLDADEPVVFMASPGRFGQLRDIERKLPGGERVPIIRCGIQIMEVYHLPASRGG